MQEDNDNIIELIDEEGESVQFEHLATIEHEGEFYLFLSEMSEEADMEDGEECDVIIMKIEQDEDGNDVYIFEEDEALQETLFQKFLKMMQGEQGE